MTRFPLLRKARVLVPHPWGALWAGSRGRMGGARPGVSLLGPLALRPACWAE